MPTMIRSALFALFLMSLPTAASAQGRLSCILFPARCQEAPAPATVPELNANAAGTASALVLGAALLIASRRRRTW